MFDINPHRTGSWRIPLMALLCCLFALPALAATPDTQNPVSAVLYPNAARVTHAAQAVPESGPDGMRALVLDLPIQADPQSMAVRVETPGVRLADLSWKQRAAAAPKNVADVVARLEAARKTLEATVAHRESLSARTAFWKAQQSMDNPTAEELERIDAAMAARLEKYIAENAALDRVRQEQERAVRNLEQELARISGRRAEAWEVTVLLQGAGNKPVRLTYDYNLANCGWQPVYRLDARPGDKHVQFFFEARIWQGSGRDWSGTEIELATVRPGSSLAPPRQAAWIIRPRPQLKKARAMKAPDVSRMATGSMSNEAFMDEAVAEAMPEPEEEQRATFAAWDLGKRALPAGKRALVRLTEETWDADFRYTLRPSRTRAAYLGAEADLGQSRQFPAGRALYMVDGALLGRGSFSLAGDTAELFFGSDPLVAATMRLKERQTGEKGFISSKQTFKWSWEIDVENHKTYPVAVRVEEPEPQSRDERIKITRTSSPKPDTPEDGEGHTLVWNLEVPANGKATITHEVDVQAPDDMQVDPGIF